MISQAGRQLILIPAVIQVFWETWARTTRIRRNEKMHEVLRPQNKHTTHALARTNCSYYLLVFFETCFAREFCSSPRVKSMSSVQFL